MKFLNTSEDRVLPKKHEPSAGPQNTRPEAKNIKNKAISKIEI